MQFLEFEKPIAELEAKIEALAKSSAHNQDVQQEIEKLQSKTSDLMKKIYSGLTDWQIIQLARHPERPYFLDLLAKIFTDFQELHGDRAFADDKAVIGGMAKLGDRPVMVIGQEKGRKTKDKLRHNFGMMHPEGYRKALRLMKLAEKFNMPVVTFIDTPGAYPGVKAEERGQSEAIARNLLEMSKLNVPIICVVIGEGCSGGALGIGVGDKLVMLEYSYFATISPEGCASILWKTADKAADAAEIMGITAKRLKEHNIVDEVIKEPLGGAHRNIDAAASEIKETLQRLLFELTALSNEERYQRRYQKLMSFGAFEG
ncbi:acetyl-CoA carboxylase carboxyltransferase subunit alpha [Fastidiosibacter lacustris]|uniref:acetyl-CoA carboxylase carboxyltransferase subunit alpha n=1 Tax=Fastidiosibacter lacustris TaxID=2056695 RepID=UPI000E349F31|nr:acetyl-CoA carboxylase carboxyltransferase subunit alpha [Fastidiosibacter lacustris]